MGSEFMKKSEKKVVEINDYREKKKQSEIDRKELITLIRKIVITK